MKPEIVLVGPLMDKVMVELDQNYVVHRLYESKDQDRLLDEIGPRIRAVATDGALGADRNLLSRLPKVEIIGIFGVGVNAVDLDYAREKGIHVTNTPDVLTDDVADMALMLMLTVARRHITADRYVRDGNWGRADLPLANRFSQKRVGILGLGRVGRAIASRAVSFGCKVSFVDPFAQEHEGYERFERLEDMANAVDFFVVSAAGGEGTGKIVNSRVLQALGPEGTLINVSRGSIVDETALVTALETGQLGAAGLDVFADEPNVPAALLSMENVVLSPHRASATVETRLAMGWLLLDNLSAHFSGKPLLTAVG